MGYVSVLSPTTDIYSVNTIGAFVKNFDAVLYNALVWAINCSFNTPRTLQVRSGLVIAEDTYMNSNLNYGQAVAFFHWRVHGYAWPEAHGKGHQCCARSPRTARDTPGWTIAIDSGLPNWTKSHNKCVTSNPFALSAVVGYECVTLITLPPQRLDVRSGKS